MTPKEKETLDYIKKYIKYHHLFPTISQIADGLKISRQAIWDRMARLCADKYIVKKSTGIYELARKGNK